MAEDIRSVLERIDGMNIWKRRGQLAPHKPLLVLYALGQLARGNERVSYDTVHRDLGGLLREFGPQRRTQHPEQPFWRLQADGLWTVAVDGGGPPAEDRISAGQLRARNAVGAFPEAVREVLRRPRNMRDAAARLLDAHFPQTLHQDILDAVGLSETPDMDEGGDGDTAHRRRRDPEFRSRVLRAYERRCCVCGYDLRIGDRTVGLEAAHIMWHHAGGPDTETNGLALCSQHHKVFDLGAFTVTPDDAMIVCSQELAGGRGLRWLLDFHGERLRPPQSPSYRPRDEYLDWHRNNIFKGPPRDAT